MNQTSRGVSSIGRPRQSLRFTAMTTTWPICVKKAMTNASCLHPSQIAGSMRVVPALPFLPNLEPFMRNVRGGWQPVDVHEAYWNQTLDIWGWPRGARALALNHKLNHELGRSNTWLPVAHVHTMQNSQAVGLWFHYARGCTDFAWFTGRTLLARDKCDAVVQLEQRARPGTGWRTAALRLAARLSTALASADFWPAWKLYDKQRGGAAAHYSAMFLEKALISCVEGSTSNISASVLEILLSNAIDFLSASILLHDLAGTDGEIDTIQFANRCTSTGCPFKSFYGPTELWDVRAFGSRRSSNSPIFGRLDGTPCKLAKAWWQCLACAESMSEEVCHFKCTIPYRGNAAHLSRSREYSGMVPSVVARLNRTRPGVANGSFSRWEMEGSPVDLERVWLRSWAKVLDCVPKHSALHYPSHR